jgi:hypothetical protein
MAAIAALVELLVPLLGLLIVLMAGHPWRVAAWVVGGLGMAAIAAHWVTYMRGRAIADRFDTLQARLAFISLTLYATFFAAGFMPSSVGLYLLAGISTWLLLSGSIEAWWLLEPKGMQDPNRSDIRQSANLGEGAEGTA